MALAILLLPLFALAVDGTRLTTKPKQMVADARVAMMAAMAGPIAPEKASNNCSWRSSS